MKQTYKFRLYPTEEQKDTFRYTLESCCIVYNWGLEQLNEAYQNKESIGRAELHRRLTVLKSNDTWLYDIRSNVLARVLGNLCRNLSSLHGSKKNGRKVGRLKEKEQFNSFTYRQNGFKILETGHRLERLHLSKIGDIPIRLTRPIVGNIKQVTIKQVSSGKWFALIMTDIDYEPVPVTIRSAVGLDVGITNLVWDSDNRSTPNPYFIKEAEKRLTREQQKLSYKKKDSSNYKKQKLKVARTYEKLVNKRDDFLHKLANFYVRNYDLIVVEDLEINDLLRKHWCSKYISDASWNKFVKMLEYKAERVGKRLIKVDAKGTTQRCSQCDTVVPKELKDRIHKCPNCGFIAPRDYNASLNILKRGLEKIGQGLPELMPVVIAGNYK